MKPIILYATLKINETKSPCMYLFQQSSELRLDLGHCSVEGSVSEGLHPVASLTGAAHHHAASLTHLPYCCALEKPPLPSADSVSNNRALRLC